MLYDKSFVEDFIIYKKIQSYLKMKKISENFFMEEITTYFEELLQDVTLKA